MAAFLVEFVDLPRLATDGKDEREAMEEAMDALGSDLSSIRLARREEIPTPSPTKREPPSKVAAACAMCLFPS
jgi:predicted RNase H-like HicB family nuclease